MAHLLNHSCEPNCYSRLTDVYDDGAGRRVEHVILYAKRDIATFEELTYDYRRGICLAFSSEPAPPAVYRDGTSAYSRTSVPVFAGFPARSSSHATAAPLAAVGLSMRLSAAL